MPHSTGLYVGSDFVDLVSIQTTKGGYRVVKSIRSMYRETAEGPIEKHRDKIDILGGAIKDILEAPGDKINSVNFCLPQDDVMIRNFKMPHLPEEDRPHGVQFEALKYIPFKIDAVMSDFYVVSETKDARDMDVLFVGINKQAVEKYLTFFKEAKIRLHIGDIAPLALMRLLSMGGKIEKDHSQVLIYLEKEARCSIIVISDNKLFLVKEVSLSAAKGVILDSILNNLKISIDYFKRETKQLTVNKVGICGEGQLTELQAYLKENMPAAEIDIFELGNEIEGLNDLSRKQLIAAGLAMASFEKPKPRINLFKSLPQPITFSGVYKEYKPLFIQAAAMVIFLIIFQVFIGVKAAKSKEGLRQIRSSNPRVTGVSSDMPLGSLQAMEGKFKARLNSFKSLVGENRFFLTKKLNTLGGFMPEGSWIGSFKFSDEMDKSRALLIDGIVYSRGRDEAALANKILMDMKGSRDFSEGFDNMRIEALKRAAMGDKEVLTFSIICTGNPTPSSDVFTEVSKRQAGK